MNEQPGKNKEELAADMLDGVSGGIVCRVREGETRKNTEMIYCKECKKKTSHILYSGGRGVCQTCGARRDDL